MWGSDKYRPPQYFLPSGEPPSFEITQASDKKTFFFYRFCLIHMFLGVRSPKEIIKHYSLFFTFDYTECEKCIFYLTYVHFNLLQNTLNLNDIIMPMMANGTFSITLCFPAFFFFSAYS